MVAAPGSGKTTLGIEFIRRFGQPTLILAPTVTIRQQWVDRIVQAFLKDESQAEQLISQDLKHPKLITVSTYQALHSAMNQVVGQSQIEDSDDQVEIETFDFKGFDIFSTFKDISLGTLCLDECQDVYKRQLSLWARTRPVARAVSRSNSFEKAAIAFS